MVRTTFGAATTGGPTLRGNESAYKTLSNTLSALHTAETVIDWNEFHRDFSSSLQLLDLTHSTTKTTGSNTKVIGV
jgi:iron transport multicopper oxidase